MFGGEFNLLSMLLTFGALIIAITVHEFSHALAAERLGDPTPRLQGRLTLNPLAHLDPLGTIMMLLVHFGWGKPVVFDPYNLRNPRRDSAIISIAGPVSNIITAIACSILMLLPLPLVLGSFIAQVLIINVILAVFNLVPIHPLDGFKIVEGILPQDKAQEWHQLERYGMFFLIFLLFPIFGGVAPIQRLISPVINIILSILLPSTAIL